MRVVQLVPFKLIGSLNNRIVKLNKFLVQLQLAHEDNRIINVELKDDIAYITASLNGEYLIKHE